MRRAWAISSDDVGRKGTETAGMTVLQDVSSKKDTARKEGYSRKMKWSICAEGLEVEEDADCCMLHLPLRPSRADAFVSRVQTLIHCLIDSA